MSEQHLVVLCTVPDRESAGSLAETVVNEHLAACVSIVPEVLSVYRWKGRAETDSELLLIIKTSRAQYQNLEQRLREKHPYELPEIIAVPITAGLAGYLAWIDSSTSGAE